MATKGNYFANKQEAIAYYREHEENFKDKPDWLIECIIDFAIQYPNYKEYCEVEAKIKAGQDLTVKQKKKYGNLKWEKEMTEYEDGSVIKDHVKIQAEGEYKNIALDKDAFEEGNKYGLPFNDRAVVTGNPDDPVSIQLKGPDGEPVNAIANDDGTLKVVDDKFPAIKDIEKIEE